MSIPNEKVIGGLSCSEVLARLSDYVDGDLPAAERARVDEHLRGCDACARFGGEFRSTVQALRAHLGCADLPVPPRVLAALGRALDLDRDEKRR